MKAIYRNLLVALIFLMGGLYLHLPSLRFEER